MVHSFRQIEDSLFTLPALYDGHSESFRRADLIGQAQGSVHMNFSIADLAPGGRIDNCVHSYEKGIFITEGEVELNRDGKAFRLGQHDFALIPIGTPHAFRNRSGKPAQWVEKCAPQPKLPGEWADSFFPPSLDWPGDGALMGTKDPLAQMVGHFESSQLPPHAKVDKYMWGWSKKLLIDKRLGSHQFDLFIIDFAKDAECNIHDHNFEEAYLVLEGEATFKAEGKEYILTPGTIGWSGVGAPHGFFMDRGTSCRWLEVMSPQPPAQNGNRRLAAWDDIRSALTS